MRSKIRITALTLVLSGIPISTSGPTYAQAPQAAPASAADDNESALKQWLASAGLGDTFNVIRVGEGPHPDPKYDLEMIQHFEILFIAASSDQASEAARFQKIFADYEAAHAVSLPEKLFYEFVDASGVTPANACVDIHVFGVVYSVYLSRADGSLVILKTSKRSTDLNSFSINIPVIAAQQQFHARLNKQSTLDPKLVRAAVEKTLKAYLDSISGKTNSKPDITPDTTNNNYLRLVVDGAKGMVTDGYWEHIDILIFFSPDAAKGKDVSWNFVCKIDMKYASSQHEPKPKDADNDFPQQTAAFRMKLVHQLQTEMEKGIND